MVNKSSKKSEIIEYILGFAPDRYDEDELKSLTKAELLEIVEEIETEDPEEGGDFEEEELLEEPEEEVVPEEPEAADSPPVEERYVVAIYRGERPYVVVGGVTFIKDREVKLTLDKIKILDAIYKNPEFEIRL